MAAHSINQPHLLMNTKNLPCLDSLQVDRVAQILYAYTHPFRYDIITFLLGHGRLPLGELASYLGEDEAYVSDHISLLFLNDLVLLEDSPDGFWVEANENRLIAIKNSIGTFLSKYR